jgi:hypothetical protein
MVCSKSVTNYLLQNVLQNLFMWCGACLKAEKPILVILIKFCTLVSHFYSSQLWSSTWADSVSALRCASMVVQQAIVMLLQAAMFPFHLNTL